MEDEPTLTMNDLMASIGTLLVRWGWLENGLAGQPLPFEVKSVRAMRNAICHGIISAHADPTQGARSHIRCRTLEGSVVSFTVDEINDAIRTLESIGGRVAPEVCRG